jgi:hypothetical protein
MNKLIGFLIIVIFLFLGAGLISKPTSESKKVRYELNLVSFGLAGMGSNGVPNVDLVFECQTTVNIQTGRQMMVFSMLQFIESGKKEIPGLSSFAFAPENVRISISLKTSNGSDVYQNNLKNRDFGKKGSQNFHSERGTIAERQDPSENANSEVNPTQPKTDSSGCFGIDNLDFITVKRGVLQYGIFDADKKEKVLYRETFEEALEQLEKNRNLLDAPS